jgi:hypothetical protein
MSFTFHAIHTIYMHVYNIVGCGEIFPSLTSRINLVVSLSGVVLPLLRVSADLGLLM